MSCSTPSACSPSTRRWLSPCATNTTTSSWTSTRTSAPCSRCCSISGWASATSSASWVTPTRRSTRSPVRVPRSSPGSALATPVPPWSRWCVTTAPRRRSSRGPGPEPELLEHPDETAEAKATATAIAGLVAGGTPAREIAVLFRTNGQSETYEQALSDAGVPYVLRGGERFFDRPEVREARLLLRGAARSLDADELPTMVRGVLSSSGWSEHAPAGGGAVRERWESLSALARLADDLAAAGTVRTLTEFVAELDERADAQHAPTVDGVTLASLHAAKGLEWDAVFIVGVTDGMIPITYAETPEAVEEERRLLYVGVTRARERLVISWPLARAPGGRASRRPSRFLDGMRAVGRSAGPALGSRSSRRKGPVSCRVCTKPLSGAVARKLGRCESCPASYDEALFERLREW